MASFICVHTFIRSEMYLRVLCCSCRHRHEVIRIHDMLIEIWQIEVCAGQITYANVIVMNDADGFGAQLCEQNG